MNKLQIRTIFIATLCVFLAACQQDKNTEGDSSTVSLESQPAKLGYMYGSQIAEDLNRSGVKEEIDVAALIQAIDDITAGKESRLSIEEMQKAQAVFQQEQQAKYQAILDENKAKGEAFLVENAKSDAVTTTDSGLQYEVLREGKGKQPADTDKVKVHYSGQLTDGTVFDSSYERGAPADFPVSGVIPGFSEGLMLMKEGAKYKLTIPAGIAYGEQAPPSIGPNQVLVFEVELIEVL